MVQVLREDPELAEGVCGEDRDQAIEDCTARAVWITAGPWRADGPAAMQDDGIGLLVLNGLLIRRVGILGRGGAELLGAGDVIRPWQPEDEAGMLATQVRWTVLEPARIALLDVDFCRQLGLYPEVAGGLFGRAIERARNLAANMAIVHHARVDVRLHMLLWHLAGRWGRVRGDGTVLPVRLTHNVLAELVAARRPTVTSALSDLAKRGLVRSSDDGWLLSGSPPSSGSPAAALAMRSEPLAARSEESLVRS
jgi:CRP/FNR family transcriptional regulator, cyclic AMP receptor protein